MDKCLKSLFYAVSSTFFIYCKRQILRKRQILPTFTPSNQCATIGTGGDENETFTGRMERSNQEL